MPPRGPNTPSVPPGDDSPFSPDDFLFQQEQKRGKAWDAVLPDLKPVRGLSTNHELEAVRCVLDGMAMLRAIVHHAKIPVSVRMDAAAKLAAYGLALAKQRPSAGKEKPKSKSSADDGLDDLPKALTIPAVPHPVEEPVAHGITEELPAGWGGTSEEGFGQGEGLPELPDPDPAPPRPPRPDPDRYAQ